MALRFDNKVVIVTGGGAGIGRASAVAFAREGGRVVVADVDPAAGNETVAQVRAAKGEGTFIQCDVRSASEVQALIEQTVRAFDKLDVLYNNAGVVRYGTVPEMSESDWDLVLDVNLRGTFLTCKYAIPLMKKGSGGAIVNTASVQAFASQQTVAAYSASKGAIVSFTKTVALDHAADRIRCNCIAPGSVRTPMLASAAKRFGGDAPQQAIIDWGKLHPLGRVAEPDEVARLALFLASDDASFCTGACFTVDGGLLAALF